MLRRQIKRVAGRVAGSDGSVQCRNLFSRKPFEKRRQRIGRPRDRWPWQIAEARPIRCDHLKLARQPAHERMHFAAGRYGTWRRQQQHGRTVSRLIDAERYVMTLPGPADLARTDARGGRHGTTSMQSTSRDWPASAPALSGGGRCSTRGPAPRRAAPLKTATSWSPCGGSLRRPRPIPWRDRHRCPVTAARLRLQGRTVIGVEAPMPRPCLVRVQAFFFMNSCLRASCCLCEKPRTPPTAPAPVQQTHSLTNSPLTRQARLDMATGRRYMNTCS